MELVTGYKKPKRVKQSTKIAPASDPYKYCKVCHLYEEPNFCAARWVLPKKPREILVRNCIISSGFRYTRRPKVITFKK